MHLVEFRLKRMSALLTLLLAALLSSAPSPGRAAGEADRAPLIAQLEQAQVTATVSGKQWLRQGPGEKQKDDAGGGGAADLPIAPDFAGPAGAAELPRERSLASTSQNAFRTYRARAPPAS